MSANTLVSKDYDFKGRDNKRALTQDELEHFDESMLLKNESSPADEVDMEKAVEDVIQGMDETFSRIF